MAWVCRLSGQIEATVRTDNGLGEKEVNDFPVCQCDTAFARYLKGERLPTDSSDEAPITTLALRVVLTSLRLRLARSYNE